MPTTPRETRVHGSLLAAGEKRVLIWIAERLPRWVNSDHLTGLGAAGMLGAGLGYALSPHWRPALLLAVFFLMVNWFGDSLDGTLARVRAVERPRYGYYVDHVLDIVGTTMLFAGLAASSYMNPVIALGVLIAYLLVAGEVFLATTTRGVFRISSFGVGPTELRILLAIGTIFLPGNPHVPLGPLGRMPLFDFGGLVAIVGMLVALATAVWQNTRALARLEPRKPPDQTSCSNMVSLRSTGKSLPWGHQPASGRQRLETLSSSVVRARIT
jgi:phosphatidylglycerophosphate synthase